MKGIDYLNSLTDDVKDKFIRNYNADTDNIPLEEYLRNEYDSLFDFVCSSFTWLYTPEGDDYWLAISNRTTQVDKKETRVLTPHKFI